MKICLIRPSTRSYFQIVPPLSLGYLSSALKASGYNEVSLIDGALIKASPAETINIMVKRGLPDVVGFQVYTGAHSWTKEFIALLKLRYPQIVTIVGGPHISALKFLALEYLGAHYGAIGEGEKLLVDFIKFLEGKISDPTDIAGLIHISNGQKIMPKESHGFIKDVNEVPFPDWDLIQPSKYFPYMEGATMALRGKRPAPILTSRGCPFRCTFCSSNLTHKRIMRYRSPKNILEEIRYLHEKYQINEIFFTDDNLTMDLNRAEEIFNLLMKEDFKIHWRAQNGLRIDRLTESLIAKMSKSGGYYIGVGIETGNQEVMKRIKKSVILKNVKSMLDLLHKYKIKVNGFFMCGLLEETEEEMNDSINFALSTPFDRIQVSLYTPYPGSEDFEIVFEANDSVKYEKNVMLFQENGYIPPFHKVDRKKIIKIQRKFILRFFLRFKILLSMVENIRISQLKAILHHPWVENFILRKDYDYNESKK